MMTATRFPLGKIVATPGAITALTATRLHPLKLLVRHAHGDWGDLDAFDSDANELALRQGMRILNAYVLLLPSGADRAPAARPLVRLLMTGVGSATACERRPRQPQRP